MVDFLLRLTRSISRALSMRTKTRTKSTNQVNSTHDKILGTNKAIVITTFSARFFEFCIPLISSLRASGVIEPVYVVINADQDFRTDSQLRSEFVSELSLHAEVFPVCLGKPSGMAKMWNMGIKCAGADLTLVLNDDINVNESEIVNVVQTIFSSVVENGLVIANGSFGHFAISSSCIQRVGVFDERFLGFGEEDGDYYWRFEEEYGQKPHHMDNLGGLVNMAEPSGHELLRSQSGKSRYSLFNSLFVEEKYNLQSGKHAGMFGSVAQKKLREVTPAELEEWESRLSPLLQITDQILIQNEIRSLIKSQRVEY